MSIMQEYEKIRTELGEDRFKELKNYLEHHPDVLLSDLYYNKAQWDACQKWIEEQKNRQEEKKRKEPLDERIKKAEEKSSRNNEYKEKGKNNEPIRK